MGRRSTAPHKGSHAFCVVRTVFCVISVMCCLLTFVWVLNVSFLFLWICTLYYRTILTFLFYSNVHPPPNSLLLFSFFPPSLSYVYLSRHPYLNPHPPLSVFVLFLVLLWWAWPFSWRCCSIASICPACRTNPLPCQALGASTATKYFNFLIPRQISANKQPRRSAMLTVELMSHGKYRLLLRFWKFRMVQEKTGGRGDVSLVCIICRGIHSLWKHAPSLDVSSLSFIPSRPVVLFVHFIGVWICFSATKLADKAFFCPPLSWPRFDMLCIYLFIFLFYFFFVVTQR